MLLLGCTAGNRSKERIPLDVIRFQVSGEMGDGSILGIPRVEVFIFERSGQLNKVGETDSQGSIELGRQELLDKAVALAFCHEWYFCGAFVVQDEDFLDYSEHYIELARIAFASG